VVAGQGVWWREAVLYQVYPRSFADSNGDGVGDLPGITGRLGYLAGLGADAIWLSPFYPSPMADFGYDITDHRAVDPVFGTLADFDQLLGRAHDHGIRVVIDFVPNHTSDQHPWFAESRSGRDSPRRDWYVWADPGQDGGPPNNWLSAFPATGSAWTLDTRTGQYYLHSYTRSQPDLNWRNPQVRRAMTGVLRFWLDRGVDGVRVDAAHRLIKDAALADNPPPVAGARTALVPARSRCATSTSPRSTRCCARCARPPANTAATGCCSARSGWPTRSGGPPTTAAVMS
jgi:alpha-glucosidase